MRKGFKHLLSLLLACVLLGTCAAPALALGSLDFSDPFVVLDNEDNPVGGTVPNREGEADAIRWEVFGNDDHRRMLKLSGRGGTQDNSGLFYDCSRPVCEWSKYFFGTTCHKVVVEEGITYLGTYAFNTMYGMEEVILPDTLTGIGDYAFGECKYLGTVYIPSSVTYIGEQAFYNSGGFTIRCQLGSEALRYAKEHGIAYEVTDCPHEHTSWTVTSEPTCTKGGVKVQVCAICGNRVATETIPAEHSWGAWKVTTKATVDVAQVETRTCSVCGAAETRTGSKLAAPKTATVSGGKYKLSGSTATFTGPAKKTAKTLIIPAAIKVSGKTYKVTAIAANACKGMTKLTSVTIGKNVKTIGKYAFKGCTKLKTITLKTSKLTAKTVGTKAFSGVYAKVTVKCPTAKVKTYRTLLKKRGLTAKAKFR